MRAETGDEDDRPWEQGGAQRRDVEPHRGGVLEGLGVTSPLGVAVWVLARRDLRKMDAGTMDQGGRRATAAGRDFGALGAALSLLAIPVALFLAAVLSFRPGV